MKLTLNHPRIDGDTVWFTWQDDLPFRPPPDGGLFIRYQDQDLSVFSESLWLEIFLALRIRSIMSVREPVTIALPAPVPARVADFWRAYYSAHNVTIEPLTTDPNYDPWLARPPDPTSDYDAAVYFGGGLDSLSDACLLGELYGRARVLLIQHVDPFGSGDEKRQSMAERYERLSLQPARELGFSTQRIDTNLHAIALRDGGRRLEPHVEQFTVVGLPMLLQHNIPVSTFGYSWIDYVWRYESDGQLRPRYPRSRMEMIQAQSRHYQRVIGIDHELLNLSLTSSTPIAFRLLAHRYPEALPITMTCQDCADRWCYQCKRCLRNGLLRMEEEVFDDSLDLDYLFTNSPYVTRAVDHALSSDPPAPGLNAPWDPAISSSANFTLICTMLHRIDPDLVRSMLSPDAWFNLTILRAFYGAQENPAQDLVPEQSFATFPSEIADFLKPIISQHAVVADLTDEPLHFGAGIVHDPFARTFHHGLLDVPHIQQEP